MFKRLALLLTVLALLPLLTAFSEEPRKVFMEGETEPFPEDAQLLTLRVCPLLGADCMLLTLGDHSMLVDIGRPTQAKTILGMLEDAGITSLEYTFNTHPHPDHIGGLVPIMNKGVQPGTFITVFPHDYIENRLEYDYFGETLRALDAAGVPVLDLKTGDKIPFGDADLTILRLPDEYINKSITCNERSAMLMVRYGDCSLLLTADVEMSNDCELILSREYDLDADIMKYPHHGMSYLANEFLEETSPEFVFFTHGAGDTKKAQGQLLQHGLDRMAFATWGLITLQTDGTKWIVRQDILPEFKSISESYCFPPH